MSKETIIKELREAADYLESRAFEVDAVDFLFSDVRIYLSCESISSFKRNVKVMGAFEKRADSDLEAVRRFGGSSFRVYIARSKVCERIVTGKRVIPARPAVSETEEDVVEYKCPKSFHDIPDNVEELVKV